MAATAILILALIGPANAAESQPSANQNSRPPTELERNAQVAGATASEARQAPQSPRQVNETQSESSSLEITTLTGKIYRHAEVIRAEPDGIVVRYRPERGGLGLAKLKFANLTDELRNQYGYDPQHAAAFEEAQWKGNAQKRSELAAQAEAFNHYRALALLNRSLAGDSFTIYSVSTQPDGRMTAQGSTGNIYPYAYPWSTGTSIEPYLSFPYQSGSAMAPQKSPTVANNGTTTASVNRNSVNSPNPP